MNDSNLVEHIIAGLLIIVVVSAMVLVYLGVKGAQASHIEFQSACTEVGGNTVYDGRQYVCLMGN